MLNAPSIANLANINTLPPNSVSPDFIDELITLAASTVYPDPPRATLDKNWTLVEGIELCRKMEVYLEATHGCHVSLGGGVLMKGRSDKDVDIFIYPHNAKRRLKKNKILKSLETIGFKTIKRIDFQGYDKKYVYHTEYDGRRVDLFFVK